MKRMRILAASIVAGSLLVGGVGQRLFAQSGGAGTATPSMDPATGPKPTTKTSSSALSPKETKKRADEYTKSMEAAHARVLQIQSQARANNDVIKLTCVNDYLLGLKQVLSIADAASRDLTQALVAEDAAAQAHQLGQMQLANEQSTTLRDEAEACLGEAIVFVGANNVTTTGLNVDNNPTDDDDLGSEAGANNGDFTSVEPVVHSSPIAPL